MNANDEELQRDLENGRTPKGDDLDVRAYREVFQALKKEPGYNVSPDFAGKVVARIVAQHKANQARDYFWFGAGIFFLILSSVGTVLFVGFSLDFGFLSAMADYKGLAVFGVLFIVFLNQVDKWLVKGKQAHY